MLLLLKSRPEFARLWASGVVSQAGDWLSYVAISLLAMEEGGGTGAMAVAVVFLAHTLPNALMAPFSGWLADRIDRRKLLIGSHLVEAIVTVAMMVAAWHRQLGWVQVLLLLRTSVSAFGYPAETAVVRELVSSDELYRANALLSATWSVMFVVGTSLGGLLAVLGPHFALAVDALTFAVAAVVLVPLSPLRPPVRELSVEPRPGALAVMRMRPELARAVMAKAPLAFAASAAWVALNLSAQAMPFMGTTALTLGVLQAVRGLGTGIGPVVVSGTSDPARHWIGAGWVMLVGMALFLLTDHPAALLVAALIWGVGSGTNWVLSVSAIQQLAPSDVIGRMGGADLCAMTLAQGAGAIAGALLIEAGPGPLVAVGMGAVAWAILWLPWHRSVGVLSVDAA
jgi:MFS family permease